jgi:hypothetical protein
LKISAIFWYSGCDNKIKIRMKVISEFKRVGLFSKKMINDMLMAAKLIGAG